MSSSNIENSISSLGDTSSISSDANTISDADIHELVDEFGNNFIAIIQKLESMIRDAKNKNSNITIGKITSHNNLSSSTSSTSSSGTPPASSGTPPALPASTQPSAPLPPSAQPTSSNNGLSVPSNVGPPVGTPNPNPTGPSGSPSGTNVTPDSSNVVNPLPSAPKNIGVNSNSNVKPDNEPNAGDNLETNPNHPTPDPSNSYNSDPKIPTVPVGNPTIIAPDIHPQNPKLNLDKPKQDNLNKMLGNMKSYSEKLNLVEDINGSLTEHINILRQNSNKKYELEYAHNLFFNMLTNSLNNINTTNTQKLGELNIFIPSKPDMGLIKSKLTNVDIHNLEDLKRLLSEFNENMDSTEQTAKLIQIYNISEKIPIFANLNGKDTLPQPILIQSPSKINENNTSDTNDITHLKQHALDIVRKNIPQLYHLSTELLEKNTELQKKMAEYLLEHNFEIEDHNTKLFEEATATSNALMGYNSQVTRHIQGEYMFIQIITDQQTINTQPTTRANLIDRINSENMIVDKYKLTCSQSIEKANQIIYDIGLTTTPPSSPSTSPDSSMNLSTDSLSYSKDTINSTNSSPDNSSFDNSSLLGLKLLDPSEYNGEIQRISKQIKKLQEQVTKETNPSYGNNIFKVLDDILETLNVISSKESTLLTTETNKKYMNNILVELSSIIKLISFCKLSNKPGYCDTINTIPSNIPNTSIDNVTSEFVDTNLPQIYAYVTQVFNNIVSNVKNEAQSYIETLEKLSNNVASDDITNQINEVLGKIITFMRGGIILDIKEADGNVLPNTEFTNIIGKIATLLNSVLNYRRDPTNTSDVNDIQFYLLKTVSNMLNCMFINNDNKTGCVKEGPIQNEINNVNEIIKKFNVSDIKVDDIPTIRDELALLFPNVTVPTLQSGQTFMFNPEEYDDTSNMKNNSETLEHSLGFNQSVSSINTSDSSRLSDGTKRTTDTIINDKDGGIIQNDQDIIDSHLENSLNNSQMSDLSQSNHSVNSSVNSVDTIPTKMSDTSNQSSNDNQMTNSTNTPEKPLGLHDSSSTIGTNTSTNTDINVLTTQSNDIDEDNIKRIKQSINDTISNFKKLDDKLNSNNTALDNNIYIYWDEIDKIPTMKVTGTTSQIILKITNNNKYFVKLLQLLRDELNASHLVNEYPITNLLEKINALISTTDDRFNYKDYEKKLLTLYNELRNLMTTTLHIKISDNTTYPQKLLGGGINDKIRFTYKNKRDTKRVKKSKPTRRRKYTPHKKNYYY